MTAPLTEEELAAIRTRQACSTLPNVDIERLLAEIDRQRALLADKDAELERMRRENTELTASARELLAKERREWALRQTAENRASRLGALLRKYQYEFDYDANHKECIGCGEREGASCAEDCPIEAELLRKGG